MLAGLHEPLARAAALIICLALAAAPIDAAARSKAAEYLINEEIEAGCGGRGGAFSSEGIYELDLNKDGHLDLILAHQGLSCNGSPSRSLQCGVQVCTIKIFHRDGRLLKLKDVYLNLILSVQWEPLVFTIMSHGGARGELRF